MRKLKLLVLCLLFVAGLSAQRFDPFAPSDPLAVRNHCLGVAYMLAPDYRVEVKWNVPEYVRPNCEMMVGIPATDRRTYRALTLPTWASPSAIAGMIDAEFVKKDSPSVLRRIGRVIHNIFTSTNQLLIVKGPLGAYEIPPGTEFSAVKQLP